MMGTIIIAFVITLLIGFMVQNIMLNFDIRKTYQINREIRNLMSKIIEDKSYFDIFIINDLRNTVNEKLLNTNMIDKYELYKVDDWKIKFKYIKGYVIQELEVLAINGKIELREINKQLLE